MSFRPLPAPNEGTFPAHSNIPIRIGTADIYNPDRRPTSVSQGTQSPSQTYFISRNGRLDETPRSANTPQSR